MDILQEGIQGTFQITSKDMNTAMGLNMPEEITEQNFEPYKQRVIDYLNRTTSFSIGGQIIKPNFTDLKFMDIKAGSFAMLNFILSNVNEIPDEMDIGFEGFFPSIEDHQSFVIVRYNWKAGIHDNEGLPSLVFDPSTDTVQTLDLTDGSIWTGFVAMVKSGMWHIWIGLDHILFLLALLLPSVMYRRTPEDWSLEATMKASNWYPVESFKPAFFYVLKIVTLFTIAHSITLSLASFQLVNLPSWLVESVIAGSIGLAAFHNIRPFLKREALVIAFGFGLFHGFGFASVLGEVGIQGEYLGYTILGFNIGVELCQIMIIAVLFPILYAIRKTKIYRPLLIYGSIFLILIALNWVVERSFDVDMPLDNYMDKAFRKFKALTGLA